MEPSDLFIYRLAGAGTLGYAGYLSIRDGRWEASVQNLAAITFNGLSAITALVYVMGGGRSLVGWLMLIAAAIFTLALVTLHVRRGKLAG